MSRPSNFVSKKLDGRVKPGHGEVVVDSVFLIASSVALFGACVGAWLLAAPLKPVLDALFLCGAIYHLDMQTEAALSDLHDSSVESLLIEKTKSVNEGISVELEWTE